MHSTTFDSKILYDLQTKVIIMIVQIVGWKLCEMPQQTTYKVQTKF
jgi:hypothetical protein